MFQNSATKPLEKVPGHTHLFRRGATYYFRLGVPANLRPIIGRRELVKSLQTPDYRLAVERVSIEEQAAREILHAARRRAEQRQTAAVQTARQPLILDSEAQAQELARAWFVELEKGAADVWREKRSGYTKAELTELCTDLAFQEDALTGAGKKTLPVDTIDGSQEVRAFLRMNNRSIDEESEGFQTLARYFREARLEHVRRHLQRVQDEPVTPYTPLFRDLHENTPSAPVTKAKAGDTVQQLTAALLEEYELAGKAPKTLSQYRVTAALLADVFGPNRDAASITRADAERFCRILETLPEHRTKRYPNMTIDAAIEAAAKRGDTSRLAPNTRRNRFFAAFTFFKYGVDAKKLSENPFDDRYLKQRFTPKGIDSREEEPQPFTIEQLQKIFTAPLYTGCVNDSHGYAKIGENVVRRGRFWVPLIALFHGMRENEICQLHTEDVRDWRGGLYFDIRPGDGKRLKNRPSRRAIPVHPELLLCGFADYVAERRKDSTSNALFPELSRAKTGSFADNFSKWFARFLQHVFGDKIEPTFHSFRHTFTDACRRADLSPQRIDRLCGWAGEGRQQREYGRDKLIPDLASDLSRVSFPSLRLSHLHPHS